MAYKTPLKAGILGFAIIMLMSCKNIFVWSLDRLVQIYVHHERIPANHLSVLTFDALWSFAISIVFTTAIIGLSVFAWGRIENDPRFL